MKKGTLAMFAAGGLAAGILGAGMLGNAYVDAALGRYPGSVAVAGESVEFDSAGDHALSRQGTYQTQENLTTVRPWYDARFHVSPASDNYTGGDCVWLSRSKQVARLRYASSVLLCSSPHGTRIVINESLGLWP